MTRTPRPTPRTAARALSLAAVLALAAGQATAAESKCKLAQLVELPVTMVGARPTITVSINGKDGQFLLDSGAFFSLISPRAVAGFGLKSLSEPTLHVKGVGGEGQTSSTTVDRFTLAGVPFRHVEFLVLSGAGAGVAGVLGENFLGHVDVEYDLANGLVRLFKPENCGSDMLAYWAGGKANTLSLLPDQNMNSRQIRAYGTLNGKRISLTFDTGATHSILTSRGADHAGVTSKTSGAISGGRTGGIGPKTVETWIAPFDSFKLDGEEVQHTRLRFGDIELADSDMLVGVDFFLSHRIYVANSQGKLYFTYNGGPVFNLAPTPSVQSPASDKLAPKPVEQAKAETPNTAPPTAPSAQQDINIPTDAAGFERRGAAFMARFDYAHAIDDFTHATALAPEDPKPLFERARARLANRQSILAMSDLDQALKLKPDDRDALAMRGALYNASGDKMHAHADLEAMAKTTPAEPTAMLVLANTYQQFGFYDEALAQYDRWIAAYPKHADLHIALERRCFDRARAKVDLDKALADCDAALKLTPRGPNALRSRGMTHFERGEFDAAIADDDALLRQAPKDAITLYARGVAKVRTGHREAGQADIAAATALAPRVADQAKQLGFAPDPG
jgi:tetratricopeptide (TPR) repeat protein/predicted aspartyl protease